MLKRLSMLIIAIICLSVNSAHSMEAVRIVVLPFKIHALKELGYLESEIPKVIRSHLKQEGAVLLEADVAPDALFKEAALDIDNMRKFGVKSGADYVIWGSLTWIGQKFSLDANIIESRGRKSPEVFFQEGEGIENLLGSVKDLSRDFSVKLFKLEKVAEVSVIGNQRIEVDAIKRVIKTKPGDIYLSKSIPEDIKAIYSMGYFDDIRVDVKSTPEGKKIAFTVKEKSTVRLVTVQGNKVFEDDEILEDLDIRTGSILNIFKVQSNISQIEQMYEEKNYHNVVVKYSIRQLKNNQADLIFVVEEGPKILVKEIKFIGNSEYSSKKLKGLMETSEKGFFSWITSSGDMKMEELAEDIEKLAAYYHNTGYISARLGEPEIEYKDNWIYITIKIDEGSRFKVGKVDIAGDLVTTRDELMKMVNVTKEEYYNRETIRDDILALTDIYSDEGYAYAEIIPKVDEAVENKVINITYTISKGKQVYFEKINITGNTKTRDKVIRRELTIDEQGLFSGKKLKRSIRNLYRLDYFEDIKVDTSKGSADDNMILSLVVEEKATGAFSFGGGYSSVESGFVMGSIEERNFLGRGHDLRFRAELGGRTTRYTLGYTEPWLFDIPLSAGIDVFNWERDYDTYVKNSMGFGLRFSYRIFDFTRVYLSYNFDIGDIRNISWFASESVKAMEGTNITSSLSTALRYDSRDRLFNPTEGSNHGITLQYAGIGGDIGFVKTVLESGWYIPIYKRLVGFLHGKGGYVREVSGKAMPDYERFYLGGMNSLRGFDWRDISPEKYNSWGLVTKIGGDKFVQFNFELLLTLIKDAGLVMVVFFDTGDVYDNYERIDFGSLRESAGFGFRWYSPMGPIRLENGYILDPEPGESSGGRWEFTMGSAF